MRDKTGGPAFLSVDDALAMLPDDDVIHTFRNLGHMLIGAGWTRDQITKAIKDSPHRQLAGEMSTNMGHGLVIENENSLLFVETRAREASDG